MTSDGPKTFEALKEALASEIRGAVRDAVKNEFDNERCQFICGMSSKEHEQCHVRMSEFLQSVDDTTHAIRDTIIKVVVTVLLVCTGVGLAWQVLKIGGFISKSTTGG